MGKADDSGGRATRVRKGLVIVNTGNGKGKTTAAIGLLTRAWGRGQKVVMLQFIKHENNRFGETRAAEKMGFELIPLGAGFTWQSDGAEKNKARCQACWERCKEKILAPDGAYDIVVLDELTYAFHYGWLNLDEVLEVLSQRPPMRHIVITGRYAPQALIEYADLVTEMRLVKHPHEQGVAAQPGIEF